MTEILLYHGLRDMPDPSVPLRLDSPDTRPEGLHLGTLAQATMRACGGAVAEISLRLPARVPRVRDRDGGWAATLRRHARAGRGVLVYLNRHEGLDDTDLARLADMPTDRVAALPDSAFRRLAPSAADSFVVLDPDLCTLRTVRPGPRAHKARRSA